MKVKFAIELEVEMDEFTVGTKVENVEKEVEIIARNMAKTIEKDWNVKYTGDYSFVCDKTDNKIEYEKGVFYSYIDY